MISKRIFDLFFGFLIRNKKLFFYTAHDAIRYFNKWDYIDKRRNKINKKNNSTINYS